MIYKKNRPWLIAADFLMTKLNEQDNNLRWMKDLLAYPIDNATGLTPQLASNYFNPEWTFSREKFFSASGIKVTANSTHFDFIPDELHEVSLNMIRSLLSDFDLIIGYELSQQTRSVLDNLNISYIDIWLGPVRFLNDLTFAIYSNEKSISAFLSQLELNDDYIKVQANIVKVQSYRGFSRAIRVIPQGSALFVGQMMSDKALLRNGKMLTLLDFKDEFAEICATHPIVYYARHPFMRTGDEEIIAFARSFRNVRIPETSGYMLLCDDALNSVYGITSSLVVESRYFGKKIRYLAQPAFDIREGAQPRYRLIMQQLLLPEFWRQLVSGENVHQIDPLTFGKDKLRDALSFYWSYREIDKVEHLRTNVANLTRRITSSNLDKDTLS
ncbi:conserved hypothetical protein [uncultured Pleomorphomonas sp.]|uniref:Capsule polysaccharide biosynthesis protein n=1 Tax=uncultured Pleomorphomonas sp. TaxID=442121 RepID=A0A212LFX2_9HYPH|nr:hypothetical protein [uncultured Pleomorphomonas sp.]SCM76445.1 conserved hypothetical protein [uncultured Pleomorphomonas sp.]